MWINTRRIDYPEPDDISARVVENKGEENDIHVKFGNLCDVFFKMSEAETLYAKLGFVLQDADRRKKGDA